MSKNGFEYQPPNTLPCMQEIWAVLSVGEDNNEGVVAAAIGPGGAMVPLIAANITRLEELYPVVDQLKTRYGLKMRLVKFSTREVVREF